MIEPLMTTAPEAAQAAQAPDQERADDEDAQADAHFAIAGPFEPRGEAGIGEQRGARERRAAPGRRRRQQGLLKRHAAPARAGAGAGAIWGARAKALNTTSRGPNARTHAFHQDQRRVERGQGVGAVGDHDDDGVAGAQAADGLGQRGFAGGIEVGVGLVEHDQERSP